MSIQIDVALDYRLGDDRTLFLAVEAAAAHDQTVRNERLEIAELERLERITGEAGLGTRIWVRVGRARFRLRYSATVDVLREEPDFAVLSQTHRMDLPGETIPYLRPSRYCQSDRFVSFVAHRFGGVQGGEKIAAMRDWIAAEMRYVPGTSQGDTTALETFAGREGVCRDYAHLMACFARAANIPARCAAVYSPTVQPPDFHAVTQVWLDGGWHIVDASGMTKARDAVLIAVGRDAADIAFMEGGPAELVEMSVRAKGGGQARGGSAGIGAHPAQA